MVDDKTGRIEFGGKELTIDQSTGKKL